MCCLAGSKCYNMEVFQDLFKSGLCHHQCNAFVAIKPTAPYTEDRLTVVNAGGNHISQEGFHLWKTNSTPTFIVAKFFLVLFGIHICLNNHVPYNIIRDKELKEVNCTCI